MNRYDKRKQPIPGDSADKRAEQNDKRTQQHGDLSRALDKLSNYKNTPTLQRWINGIASARHDPKLNHDREVAAFVYGIPYADVSDEQMRVAEVMIKNIAVTSGESFASIEARAMANLPKYVSFDEMTTWPAKAFLSSLFRDVPKAPPGKHNHAEAFCLMWYECAETPEERRRQNDEMKNSKIIPGSLFSQLSQRRGCGHRERMWNSRDGVTPFGDCCPSCGGTLNHANFRLDEYAPEHKPHRGQRVWRDATYSEWRVVFERFYNHESWGGHFDDKPEGYKERLVHQAAKDAFEQKQPYLEVTP